MDVAYGIPSYLRCAVCGHAMKGECHTDASKFRVWCVSYKCPEKDVQYLTDAPTYPLTKLESD